MEMRKLSGEDLFPLLNIIAKIGIKDVIQEIFKKKTDYAKKIKASKAKDEEAEAKGEVIKIDEEIDSDSIGYDVVAQITELVFLNIGRAKREINTLIASLCDVKREEIEKLSMSEYMGVVMDFLSQEEFKASMNVIMSSFK